MLQSLFHIDVIHHHCIDCEDSQGQTMLSLAALNGHGLVVELLLGKTADPKHRDKKKRIPLMLAAMNGHEAVVVFLY